MLEELEEQQKKCYPADKVWIVTPEDFCSRQAELVIANLAVEYLGVEKVADWVRESGAEHASVVIYGIGNQDSLKKTTGSGQTFCLVSEDEVVWNFQDRGMDLTYMREIWWEERVRMIRMDFTRVF